MKQLVCQTVIETHAPIRSGRYELQALHLQYDSSTVESVVCNKSKKNIHYPNERQR